MGHAATCWLLPLLLASSRVGSADDCADDNAECESWADMGECTKVCAALPQQRTPPPDTNQAHSHLLLPLTWQNPGFMHMSCKKSCHVCPKSKSKGKSKSAEDGETGTSDKSAGPVTSDELLADGAYRLHAGRFSGKTTLHTGRFDLRAARVWCDAKPTCYGFTAELPEPQVPTQEAVRVVFRAASQAESVVEDVLHVSFAKVRDGLLECDDHGSDDCRTKKSSYRDAQLAAYYVRTAELYGEKGAKHAQDVINQVRAALLSGASREGCYMLRAPAYLQLQNVDNAKRDLSAILKNDPDHDAARKLHRKVKDFAKAVDAGVGFEGSRQWQDALQKFEKAAKVFDPPLQVPALRSGLCKTNLRLRFAADAVKWCQSAYDADQDDLEVLFALADAKVLNGEDHAALQLLKTAQQTRHRRNGQLHQKVQNLERSIKNKSKVNYYKVLGVERAASAKVVKRAYHKLAMKWHPDKVGADDKEKAEKNFKKIARAYEVLGDKDTRARYDRGEDVDDPNANQQQQQHNPFGGGGFRHHFHGGM